jgi:hypothetical protein
MTRTYSELSKLSTFEERFQYLKLGGSVGESTFGFDRYLNQIFYKSKLWKRIRDEVIFRDCGCDLGVSGREIFGSVIIHHMNPITIKDIEADSKFLTDPEYLITTTHNTHNAIHYSDEKLLMTGPIERTKNDTCPWRRN